ncbi:hypothetical protein HK100_011813 [Physocladia obscura]|uniref:Uncharacterized protein n=1 Tax=Physocladia obscura TaxID=109957 RepID=A0AAD5T0R2_9FUNG|nr:hypothetical protein HK100_011813 [Physocladia obscura]
MAYQTGILAAANETTLDSLTVDIIETAQSSKNSSTIFSSEHDRTFANTTNFLIIRSSTSENIPLSTFLIYQPKPNASFYSTETTATKSNQSMVQELSQFSPQAVIILAVIGTVASLSFIMTAILYFILANRKSHAIKCSLERGVKASGLSKNLRSMDNFGQTKPDENCGAQTILANTSNHSKNSKQINFATKAGSDVTLTYSYPRAVGIVQVPVAASSHFFEKSSARISHVSNDVKPWRSEFTLKYHGSSIYSDSENEVAENDS